MANKVLTFVIDTVEADLDPILAAAVNEIQKAGHAIKAIRVADDSGESLVPSNMIAGVNPPEEKTDQGAPTFPPAK